jgi:hypothetical protein
VFPSLSWDASASDVTFCSATISKFVTGFPSLPANCSSFTPSTDDWNNFKRGFVPPGGVSYNLGTSFDTCKTAAPPVIPGKPEIGELLQPVLCDYVNQVAQASTFCDKLYCITDNANVGVSSSCSGTAQRTCKSLLPSANSVLKAAVNKDVIIIGDASYDWTKVDVNCADNCRSVAGGNTGGDTGGNTGGNKREDTFDTGGAMGVSLVAFAVISGLSVSLM